MVKKYFPETTPSSPVINPH